MKKYLPLVLITPVVVLLDQLTKGWILQNIPYQTVRAVWPGYFDLVHFRNPGVAFSMLDGLVGQGHQWFFFLVTAVAATALLWLYAKSPEKDRGTQIPLAFILGGALGNVIDRALHGEVIDFLYFHWQQRVADFDLFGRHFHFVLAWPAFNVADSAITCGALFLALKVLFLDSKVKDKRS
ncbi:MAG TPA: signal peptidase II [bacterium]|nr:signal peptidase II [bacterium]